MPIYEVRCDYCVIEYETICKYDDLKYQTCPYCGKPVYVVPSTVSFNIEGHSFANGYNSQPEKDYTYQGTEQSWEP